MRFIPTKTHAAIDYIVGLFEIGAALTTHTKRGREGFRATSASAHGA